MCIPVHSPWLPGYVDVMQTIVVLLTMAALFPDRPHVCVCVCVCVQCNVFIEAEQIFKESSIVYAKDAKRKHWGEIYNIQKIPRYIDFAIWK